MAVFNQQLDIATKTPRSVAIETIILLLIAKLLELEAGSCLVAHIN
jgi:hypothetical protein